MKVEELKRAREAFDRFFEILENKEVHLILPDSNRCVVCGKSVEEAEKGPCHKGGKDG